MRYLKHILIFLPVLTVNVSAQEAGKKMVPLSKILQDGGWPMIVLGVLSVFAVFMVIYFFCTLRLNIVIPLNFRIEAEDMATNRDIETLHAICKGNQSAGAQIIGAVTRLLLENPKSEYLIIRDVIEDEGSRQANALWQKIQYLMDVAVVAPMVGLLGTVVGMIQAFVGLQEDFGAAKPIALANGVSKALVTTAGGLIIGIIAMLFYSYFRGHVNALITQLEDRCSHILYQFIFEEQTDDSGSTSEKDVRPNSEENAQSEPDKGAVPSADENAQPKPAEDAQPKPAEDAQPSSDENAQSKSHENAK